MSRGEQIRTPHELYMEQVKGERRTKHPEVS